MGKKLEVKDFVYHFRNRYEDLKDILNEKEELENLVSINKLSNEKQKFSVIGMVYSKKITKNKNILLEIEDLTGKLNVLISSSKEDLLKESEDILTRLEDIKSSKDKEFEHWRSCLEDMERKLLWIDKQLFGKG